MTIRHTAFTEWVINRDRLILLIWPYAVAKQGPPSFDFLTEKFTVKWYVFTYSLIGPHGFTPV